MRIAAYAGLVLAAIAVAGCDTATEPDSSGVTLTLTPAEVVLRLGDSIRIEALVRDARGVAVQRVVVWDTPDTSLIALSALGVVRARAQGIAHVIGSVDGQADTAQVTISVGVPSVVTVSPSTIEAGSPGLTLEVTGHDFVPASRVQWNGQSRATVFVDSTRMTAALGAGDLAKLTSASVTVVTPMPGGGTSAARAVTVGLAIGPAPNPIAAGSGFTCASTVSGSYCWGINGGRFGDGTYAGFSPVPTVAAGGRSFRHLSLALDYPNSSRGGACGLTGAGAVLCWGDGSYGQLGDPNRYSSLDPVAVAPEHDFADLAYGQSHVCAVTKEGDAYCWGENYGGQLGSPRGNSYMQATPTRVPGSQKWAAIAAGSRHSCALTREGAAYCWGTVGLLGNGEPREAGADQGTRGVVPVSGEHVFARITAGMVHTCALTLVGETWCWGESTFGQAGANYRAEVPQRIAVAERFIAIDAGTEHTCAIAEGGAGYCWGYNNSGRLGAGSAVAGSSGPVQVAGGIGLRSIAAGGSHSCAIGMNGAAYCWGLRGLGLLGNNTLSVALEPVAVLDGQTLRGVAVGREFSCGNEAAGAVRCWGANDRGQLGVGTATGPGSCANAACSWRAVPIAGLDSVQSVAAGWYHACALRTSGQAHCWGDNAGGAVGDGTTTSRPTPVPVSSGVRFRALRAGLAFTCGLALDGAAWCWGANSAGQLGDGGSTNSGVPVRIDTDLRFVDLSAGRNFACGLTSAGAAHCWGSDEAGQLTGLGGETCVLQGRGLYYPFGCSRRPVRVASGLSFRAIASGDLHSCGVSPSGSTYCWGHNNYGQAGVGPYALCAGPSSTNYFCVRSPRTVDAPTFVTVGAGNTHSCGLTATGALWCWGKVDSEYLVPSAGGAPRQIQAPPFVAVSGGYAHACGIAAAGGAWCWGDPGSGQLGDGRLPNEPAPGPVAGGLRF